MDEIAGNKTTSLDPDAFSDFVFFYCVSMVVEEVIPYKISMAGTAPSLKKFLAQPFQDCLDAVAKKIANNNTVKMETLDQFRLREQILFKQQVQHASYQIWPEIKHLIISRKSCFRF